MLAVVPSRTDPTMPMLPQAFQNAFYQFPAAERFIRGLARRDSDSVGRLCVAGLATGALTLLVGGLPTAAVFGAGAVGSGLSALVAMAYLGEGVHAQPEEEFGAAAPARLRLELQNAATSH